MGRIVGGVQSVVTFPNYATFSAQVINIPSAGTPVQLPSIVIPDGASLFVRARLENGNKKVFLANTSANALLAANRLTLRSGEGVELNIQNADGIWVNSSANNVEVELFVEQ
jgi:hypothetical protein